MNIDKLHARAILCKDVYDTTLKHTREARDDYEAAAKALGDAVIAANGRNEGDEITLADGSKAWIDHLHFRTYERKLVAVCYRTLKTGKRSVRPDLTVTLWKEPSQ